MDKQINKIVLNFNKKIRDIEKASHGAMYLAASYLRLLSIKKTPIDTGVLRNSTQIHQTRNAKGGSEVYVYNNAEYAVQVHEDLNTNFKRGGAKFLERAVTEAEPKMVKIIIDSIKEK